MARLPLTIDSRNYSAFFEEFVFDVGGVLADAMLDNGVAKDKAYDIVGAFLFNYAMMFDDGGRYKTAGKMRPQVAFSNGLGQLAVPTKATYLHEKAFDLAERVFNVEGRR